MKCEYYNVEDCMKFLSDCKTSLDEPRWNVLHLNDIVRPSHLVKACPEIQLNYSRVDHVIYGFFCT